MVDQCDIENWRPLVGHEDLYEISDRGRVRSVPRIVRRSGAATRHACGRVRRLYVLPNGYVQVDLWRDNKRSKVYIHQAVLAAFVGSRPEGAEACHNNGVRSDNRLSNLRWDSHSGNQADAIRMGTFSMGERHYNAKLSADNVQEIFRMRNDGMSQKSIGEAFGVGQYAVWAVLSRRTWKSIKVGDL